MIALAYVIFTLSGAAGLIYESVWSRYLALFVGHSAYAQVLVLGIFLGGMAIGAGAAGKYSERFRDPLLLYAGAELAIALLGLAFHPVFVGTTGFAYDVIFPAVGTGLVLGGIKWTLAAVLILPQAVLLGTTFPLMAAAIIRRMPRAPGHVLGLLYFTNNIGAAAGVLIAGFYLLAVGGLPGTVLTAAVVNLVVAGIAFGIARVVPAGTEHATATPVADTATASTGLTLDRLRRLLLIVAFGTAVASFGYEIAWIRMLSLVLGSATHSFEIMLSAFIFGMALGAFWIRSRADRLQQPLHTLGIVQWAMGLAAIATLPLYGWTFEWVAWLLQTFTRTDAGYTGFSLGKYAASLAVMLPSTICAGMTLPLITRILVVGGEGEKGIGEVYSVNTIGAIVGVALAALLIMPLVGVRRLLIIAATLDMALGIVLLVTASRSRLRRPTFGYGVAVATVGLVVLTFLVRGVDPGIRAGGVFRYGTPRPTWLEEVEFYRDGRTASVATYRTSDPPRLVVATNGKADGSIPTSWLDRCERNVRREAISGDIATQTLGPLITLAHATSPRRGAVIGHGTGMSGHILLGDPRLEEVVTIEIEPQMVYGSTHLYPANERVFDDERSRIVVEDARTYFAAGDELYDVIVATPSNPWVSGVASLFTVEFYGRVSRHLSEGGVFGQWFQLYEMDDDLVLTVLSAVGRVFNAFTVFQTSSGDLLIVASNAATMGEPDWSVLSFPALGQDLCHVRPLLPDDLGAVRLTDAAVLAPILERWDQPNSDYYPFLELHAERTRFANALADGFVNLGTEGFNIAAALGHDTLTALTDTRPASANIGRLHARSAAAYFRSLDGTPPPVSDWPDDLREGRFFHERWHEMLEAAAPQEDWWFWLSQYRVIHADRSSGITGVADSAFFATVRTYLDNTSAPDIVRQAVEFDAALDAWDFELVSNLVDRLASPRRAEPYRLGAESLRWISPTLLVEGGVVAKLRIGDVAGARRIYDEFVDEYERPPTHVRRRLLEAHLAGAGGTP